MSYHAAKDCHALPGIVLSDPAVLIGENPEAKADKMRNQYLLLRESSTAPITASSKLYADPVSQFEIEFAYATVNGNMSIAQSQMMLNALQDTVLIAGSTSEVAPFYTILQRVRQNGYYHPEMPKHIKKVRRLSLSLSLS
jgi:hypothetical protein